MTPLKPHPAGATRKMLAPFMCRGEVIQIMGPRQARMQSKSTDGVWYAVDADARRGNGSCSCRGFEIRKQCRHLTAWKRFLETGQVDVQEDDLEEAFPVTEGATA